MKNIILFIVALSFASCGLNTRSHYFDLEDFTNGKVYVFECEEDQNFNMFLEMTSNLNDQTLTTTTYGANKIKSSVMVEKFTGQGSEMVSLYYVSQINGEEKVEVEGKVLQKDVMLWSVTNKPFEYSVKMERSGEIGETLTSTRSYVNRAHIDVMGEKYEVYMFKDVITYDAYPDVYLYNEYYAEGLGLVAMDFIEGDETKVLKLVDILTLEEWKEYQ